MLSLPSGVAFFADEKSALIPSSIICAVFGVVAAYTFSAIGRVCKDQNSNSFQDAWAKTISPKTAGLISGCITAMCFLASLAYSIIIGDAFTSLFKVSKNKHIHSLILTVNYPDFQSADSDKSSLQRHLAAFVHCALPVMLFEESQFLGSFQSFGSWRVKIISYLTLLN